MKRIKNLKAVDFPGEVDEQKLQEWKDAFAKGDYRKLLFLLTMMFTQFHQIFTL